MQESNSVNPADRLDAQPAAQETRLIQADIRRLASWIGGAALLLFLCSSLRHFFFLSTAFDLGIYDQVVYLMSQGLPPISSFLDMHHLGNHAAWSVYGLALLYRLYPSVYWLLAVQAGCLALGALPTWLLARQAGLSRLPSLTMAIVYLLYPLIFNLNLFDFHPEVMALPAILFAIWAARADHKLAFCIATGFALGCRDALSLTIAAMGLWLLLVERRRFCGLFALLTGAGWFLLVTQWLIPAFGGAEVAAVRRYAYLGDSVLEVAKNLVLRPDLVLGRVLRLEVLQYVGVLLLPVAWGLGLRQLLPLVVALPTLALNILAEASTQMDLNHQYSLPIVPFLITAVIDSLAAGRGWLHRRRWIIAWSLLALLLLLNPTLFNRQVLRSLDSWQASRAALAQIQTQDGVLVDSYLAPHVTHRPIVRIARPRGLEQYLLECQYVLINLRLYRGEGRQRLEQVIERVAADPRFQLRYHQDKVYLFTREAGPG